MKVSLVFMWVMIIFLDAMPSSAVEWQIHGALKNETAYFISGNAGFDKIQNKLDLQPEAMFGDRWEFRSRVLAWYDAATNIETTNATTRTAAIQKYYQSHAEIKEAYLLYAADDFDLRLGQQQVVWGKTDGLRLLDIINPLNMQEFLLDDFLDSRTGIVAARMNYYTSFGGYDHEFEWLVIPDAKVAKTAPRGSRWAFLEPPLPTGVIPVELSSPRPNWSVKETEYGAAWRANLEGWDLSLNWFYGWKDSPTLSKGRVNRTVQVQPVYQKIHTLGASFSNAFGPVVLRSEWAVNLHENIATTTQVKAVNTWNAAVGLDYNQHNWRISPQVFIRHITKWESIMLEDRNSGFMSLMISTDYLNDKLKPEVIALLNWRDHSQMIRPKLSYEWSDQTVVKVGLDFFLGQSSAFFGQFDLNDRVYSEIEYTF